MLLITLLCLVFSPPGPSKAKPTNDCLMVTYTIEKVNASQEKIVVEVKGGQAPYYYFFFDEKKKPFTWEFQNNYWVVKDNHYPATIRVIDSGGCSQLVAFTKSTN